MRRQFFLLIRISFKTNIFQISNEQIVYGIIGYRNIPSIVPQPNLSLFNVTNLKYNRN